MLTRAVDSERLRAASRRAPVVLLVGPRQAGKTTLAGQLADPRRSNNFDAEYPPDTARLAEPLLALQGLEGLVLIDEAQHVPDLFPVLRVLTDRPGRPAQFLILGSASPELVGLAAESLAGRVEIIELAGLRAADVGAAALDRLWLRGGLPPSFTAADETDSAIWRDNYIATFLERDLAQLGFRIPATAMRRAWTSLAHRHAQLWNGAEMARALDVAQTTARRYLDALTDSLLIRQLPPWFANLEKRQVKSPKVYVRDAGLLHRLVGLRGLTDLMSHPIVGASWEGFVIEQVAMILGQTPLYFWRTHQGAELDVYVEWGGMRLGLEIKRTAQPRVTRSMHVALDDLALDVLIVVYPGDVRIQLAERIVAVPLAELVMANDGDEFIALVR